MVPPTRCKLSCVKVLKFKTSVIGNLVPFLEKFLPAICRGHTESSGGNLRLAIGSTIINVNDLLLGHNKLRPQASSPPDCSTRHYAVSREQVQQTGRQFSVTRLPFASFV